VVTRPREQADELASALRTRGATALAAPAISLAAAPGRALDDAVAELAGGGFEWLILTSRAGVEAVFERLAARGLDGGMARVRVAAVGDGTAGALRERGIEPDLVPATFTTDALARALPQGTGRILLARADIAPGEMEETLRRRGWTPVRVEAYRTRLSGRVPAVVDRALRDGMVDAVTFTSASTVAGFVRAAAAALAAAPRGPKVACIGPVTARAARSAGLAVGAVADPHTIEGLVAAVERLFASRRAGHTAEQET
jgi:uroporphyrinogen-III synthase